MKMKKFYCRNCNKEFNDSDLKESVTDKRFMKYKCKCKKVNLISKRELNETETR